eukprot:scpid29876/ scgid14383/ SH3 domain-binding protein 2
MSRAVENWSHAEVCLWLRTSGFVNLTDKFSQLNIVGSDLKMLDDGYLHAKLGIADPLVRYSVLSAVDSLLAKAGLKRGMSYHSGGCAQPAAPGQRPNQPNLPSRPSVMRGQTVPASLGSASTMVASNTTTANTRTADDHQGQQRSLSYTQSASSIQHAPHASHHNAQGKRQSLGSVKTGTMSAGVKPSLGVSAQQLMADGHMDCCGWIRKQGGSVRSWKRRYLILKSGCMYYYKDESSSSAQGQFSLEGYRIAQATDTKYPWCVKLVHINPKKRTYFISLSSEPEMRQWMEKIDHATRQWMEVTSGGSQPPASPSAVDVAPPPVLPRPASTLPGHARSASGSSASSASNALRTANSDFVEHDLDDEEDSEEDDTNHSPSGYKRAKSSPSPEVAPRQLEPSVEEAEPNDYLQLNEGSIIPPEQQPPPPKPVQNGGGRPIPSPSHAAPTASRIAQRYEITDLKKVPAKTKPQPEMSSADEECDYIFPEVENRDILPASVFQDGMDRDTAEGILKRLNHTGSYLIRSGSAQPNQKVLSVWTEDRCRHYKVFFDEKLKFSLQRGTHFATLPTLVQHYHANSLPKCEYKLSEPYHG